MDIAAAGSSSGVAPSPAAQLTYTSFDDGSGPGGWQIKQVVGQLHQAEQDVLIKRIPTVFDLEPRLPQFPTQNQIDSRPGRLSYQMLDGSGAYWHTVDAGRDASGRPGNVFAHVAVDRRPVAARADRPIVRWRSADWLIPYGPVNVAAATIDGQGLPRPNPEINLVSAVQFLLGQAIDRQGVFRVLLDAVARALAGGPSVVLLTADPGSPQSGSPGQSTAARWIAAVSFFLPLSVAQRFSWATHDGLEYAEADIGRGVHLIAMPRTADPEPGRPTGAVVIDEAEVPDLGDLGSTHGVARGEVPVGLLSVLAEGVLADEHIAISVLTRCEEVAEEFADGTLTPLWPLAIAVEEVPDLAEFHADALRAIAEDAPDGVNRVPWAARRVATAREANPRTADQLLAEFVQAHEHGGPVDARGIRFLAAVIADPRWVVTGPVESVPSVRVVDLTVLRPDLDERIAALAGRRGGEDSAGLLTEGLRLAEVIDRVALRGDEFDRISNELVGALDVSGLGEFFWEPQQNWPVGLAPTLIGPDVRAGYVRPLLARYRADGLWAIPAAHWMWVFADSRTEPGIPVPANPTRADSYLYPLAVAQVLGDPLTVRTDRATRREWATDAVNSAIASEHYSDAECRGLVAAIIELECPDVEDLRNWSSSEPERTGPALLRTPVFTGPVDQRLFDQVITAERDPGREPEGTDATVAAAVLRRWRADPNRAPLTREQLLGAVRLCVADDVVSMRACAPDLTQTICAGYVVGQLAGEAWAPPAGVAPTPMSTALSPIRKPVYQLLKYLSQTGVIDTNWLVAQSFLRFVDGRPPVRTLMDIADPAWVDRILERLIADGYPVADSESALRDTAWPVVARGDAARAEAFFDEYRNAAKDWLKEFGHQARDRGLSPRSGKDIR
ncbi:GAP1-N2 domain-containing protein [Gordonia pseudamarae]|jgi:hypothetical protein|uniref:Uncharacterized protein n=1 Tax=Gordonia pseudamarae TaxID=2831662 RepID=A0ABX6IEH6_9ACTN|nr:hypothetical protein [Gordonia pseudamarae]QHN33670.1 hypothetical protein GII31_00845 [Gordonia pseudamarae]